MVTSNVSTNINKVAGSKFVWTLSDIWEMAKRNLIRYSRQPVLIGVTFVQPIMFVLLFIYVFGGAIHTPGGNYVNYLIPGIIIQAVLFGAVQTGVGLSEDMKKGLIDRFRSLRMSRSAVLAGRVTADLVRNVFVLAIIIGIGYAVGFRIQTDLWSALLGVVLALAFSFAMMWIMAIIGLLVKNAETTQVGTMVITFPLVFVSSAFVPVETMPKWLQVLADINPVTVTVDAIRGLLVSGQYTPALWQALFWIGGMLLVFIPLAINRYQHSV
jgi:ABC-2 type transport system permease protein/oleandomycin transport system permease protein